MPKAFGELCASGKERSAVSTTCSGMVALKSSELVRHLRRDMSASSRKLQVDSRIFMASSTVLAPDNKSST